MREVEDKFIMVYPDPILHVDMLSGASFLYFDNPIALTLPPVVINKEAYEILSLIENRKPAWRSKFDYIFNLWRYQLDCYSKAMEILEPLKDKKILSTWTIYPADSEAMNKADQLIKSANISIEAAYNMINPISGCGEIIRHIMLESFLELGKDINSLYDYCGELFNSNSLEYLITKGYFLRLSLLKNVSNTTPILLTNSLIWDNILNKDVKESINKDDNLDEDVVSWEIFRQIISPYLDPLDKNKVRLLDDILRNRSEEINRLKLKCYSLTSKIKPELKYGDLVSNVTSLIKREVQSEVSDLLKLDRKALDSLFYDIFSDEKTWISIAAFISGIVGGNVSITTGGAISALSFVGAKSVKAMGGINQELSKNPYGLVYTLSRK